MKLVPITDIFDIHYGNKFDISKMDILNWEENGINFVNRSAENNGISWIVWEYNGIEPYSAGLITVAMGWSVLSSFIQPKAFYSGQNVKILTPRIFLSEWEKIFYCAAIEANKFRYGTCGREANTTFTSLTVPALEEVPERVRNYNLDEKFSDKPLSPKKPTLDTRSWKWFQVDGIFDIFASKDENLVDSQGWIIPYISSSEQNNWLHSFIDAEPSQWKDTITVARIWSVGATFYHGYSYAVSSDNVRVFQPKFTMNKYIGIFLATLISKEKYRYAYWRTFSSTRMKETKIKLPVTPTWSPDWQWMEDYIKGLSYSAAL
jgi:Type I restriction modification DNA specificity domain